MARPAQPAPMLSGVRDLPPPGRLCLHLSSLNLFAFILIMSPCCLLIMQLLQMFFNSVLASLDAVALGYDKYFFKRHFRLLVGNLRGP